MPPWPTRLLSGASSSNGTPTRQSIYDGPSNRREKPLPRPPPGLVDVADRSALSSLNDQRAHPSPPSATFVSRLHSKSISHTLPKLLGRNRSAGNINGYHETDVPLDDVLVPVLDQPPLPTPTRLISGKKKALDGDGEVTRRCMCCDSRVKVPRDLARFRCMCCLMINDLEPAEPTVQAQDNERDGRNARRPDTYPGQHPRIKLLPLNVEQTKTIIDKCLVTYLEARCRHQETLPRRKVELQTVESPPGTPTENKQRADSADGCYDDEKEVVEQIIPNLRSASPPDTPTSIEAPSASIRDFSDLNTFAFYCADTLPRTSSKAPVCRKEPSVTRKPIPKIPDRKPPPPPVNIGNRTPSQHIRPEQQRMTPDVKISPPKQARSPRLTQEGIEVRKRYDRVKTIFQPLEEYVVSSFGNYECLNSSFSTARPAQAQRTRSDESGVRTPPAERNGEFSFSVADVVSELDAKTLLLGDFAENGSWWTGRLDRKMSEKATKRKPVPSSSGARKIVTSKTPHIDWLELARWYDLLHTAGQSWRERVDQIKKELPVSSEQRLEGRINAEEIEDDLDEAREHAIRSLLKVSENLLKRPSKSLQIPEDLRFLLILLSNPSLYPSKVRSRKVGPARALSRSYSDKQQSNGPGPSSPPNLSPRKSMGEPGRDSGQHTGILKRIFGLLANSSDACHRYMIGWLSRFSEEQFSSIVDLVASFVTYRLARRTSRPHGKSQKVDGGLIPDLSGSMMNTSAQLHSALGLSGGSVKKRDDADGESDYCNDWQIKAASKLMSLLFAANNNWQGKSPAEKPVHSSSGLPAGISPKQKSRAQGQLLSTSNFYNTLLDYQDLIADFKLWEAKRENRFAFCQYPLFLSMGAKIKILEYDARRQMEIKAREAYFDQVTRHRAIDGHFHLRVRRDCMVDDSLRQISEAVGAGQEELKKGLRVHFQGEEGVDAGGLRKEWFLMLVRDIFDPNHGMFVYDDESHTCYFNPNSFETSDQYYLVGALLGLAIYNSTILDVALPLFAFRKLLAAAPSAPGASSISPLIGTKGQMTYTLADLAEFRPSLAAGLQQLLDFDGDVQETYCRDFVAPVERYGITTNIPLKLGGDDIPVTNANRSAFVELYVRYLLDIAVARQFEPFKRGFFTVCAGNALSLFRAEEIELLVRGSDESLDVDSLRAVAVYENWRHFQPAHALVPNPAESIPVVGWFWDFFARADPTAQRKLLGFITGSDRIPAVGATSLILRIVAGGDGWGGGGDEERQRFPVARTCFNMLVLWRYDCREHLEDKLWRAVQESEGFGLK